MNINTQAAAALSSEVARAAMTPDELQRQVLLEQRRKTLESRRITPETKLRSMHFLFRLFGKPCFPRGELVAITGKAKSGKTYVTSMLMTLCARRHVLSFSRMDEPLLRLLWIDTEQSDESTQDILCNRIMPMIADDDEPPDDTAGGSTAGADIFNLRCEPWQERMPLLKAAVAHYKPDLVIVDGIRDLVNDINDGVLSQSTVEQLMQLASDGQCCIVCVLHQNKSAEDHNLRGFIGTELTNKAFEVYSCEKLMPERIFKLKQELTRKYDITSEMMYTVGDDGLPRLYDQAAVGSQRGMADSQASACRLPIMNQQYVVHGGDSGWQMDVKKLFSDAFKGYDTLTGNDMRTHVMKLGRIGSWMFYNKLLEQATAQGVIVRSEDASRRVVYTLAQDTPL